MIMQYLESLQAFVTTEIRIWDPSQPTTILPPHSWFVQTELITKFFVFCRQMFTSEFLSFQKILQKNYCSYWLLKAEWFCPHLFPYPRWFDQINFTKYVCMFVDNANVCWILMLILRSIPMCSKPWTVDSKLLTLEDQLCIKIQIECCHRALF